MLQNKHYLLLLILVVFYSCGTAKKSIPTNTTKAKLEQQYKQYQGIAYKYGGTDKNGFDCSGFVNKVYKDAFNIQLPRTTKEMAKLGKKINRNNLKIGDLVFFKPSKKYMHLGIYVGNNLFMHSSSSKGVTKSSINNAYWIKKYKFAKRILTK